MPQAARLTDRALATRAWINALLHGVGLIAMAAWIKPGSLAFPVDERIRYLVDAPAPWVLSWVLWALAAVSMAWLTHGLASRIGGAAAWSAFGVSLSAAIVDISCDCLWIDSAAVPDSLFDFEIQQAVAFFGGACVANGLYTLGVVLLLRALAPPFKSIVGWLGWGVVLAGFSICVVAVTGPLLLIEAATGLTLLGYPVWTLLVVRQLRSVA